MVQTNLFTIADGGKTSLFWNWRPCIYIFTLWDLQRFFFHPRSCKFFHHVQKHATLKWSSNWIIIRCTLFKRFHMTTHCVIMCECNQRVDQMCQIYDVSRSAAFHIAKELLMYNNRLRCNHPLMALLFSNHLSYNLVNRYTLTQGNTHCCLRSLQCLPRKILRSTLPFPWQTELQNCISAVLTKHSGKPTLTYSYICLSF